MPSVPEPFSETWLPAAPFASALSGIRRTLRRPALSALLFLAAFLMDFPALWQVWTTDPRLSHAPLVIVLAGGLVWSRRADWQRGITGGRPALALIACCALLHVGAVWADVACLKPLALVGMAGGMIALRGGWRCLAQASGVLGWLLFLIPWPATLTTSLQFWMQLVSSRWAALFCGMGGVPIRCQGVELFVQPEGALAPTVRVLVAQPCSGLASTLALLAVAYFLALLTPARLWARGLLAFAALPCALLLNALRITLIVGASASQHCGLADWLHAHEEPFLVLLCSVSLLGLRAILLACAALPLPSSKEDTETTLDLADSELSASSASGTASTRLRSPLAALNFILLLTLAGSIVGAHLESAPAAVPNFLRGLALPYPGWRQAEVPLAAGDIAALQPDSLLMRRWTNPQGDWTELTVIAGHRKRALHTPAYCLRGGGWEPLAENNVALALPSGPVPATSLTMMQGDQRILVTYFFSDGAACAPEAARFQTAQLWRRLQPGSHRPSIAALIRIVMPLRGEDAQSALTAQAQTQAFARATLPAILNRLRAVNSTGM